MRKEETKKKNSSEIKFIKREKQRKRNRKK